VAGAAWAASYYSVEIRLEYMGLELKTKQKRELAEVDVGEEIVREIRSTMMTGQIQKSGWIADHPR